MLGSFIVLVLYSHLAASCVMRPLPEAQMVSTNQAELQQSSLATRQSRVLGCNHDQLAAIHLALGMVRVWCNLAIQAAANEDPGSYEREQFRLHFRGDSLQKRHFIATRFWHVLQEARLTPEGKVPFTCMDLYGACTREQNPAMVNLSQQCVLLAN